MNLSIFRDTAELAEAAAHHIIESLSRTIAERGMATLVLSGGQTPVFVYRALAEKSRTLRLVWDSVHFFWGDERCVPPDDAASNFRMAQESLLGSISVPASNVHRIKGENPAASAAVEYSAEVRRAAKLDPRTLPVFDLILLGVGEDGHVASLFPGSSAETETKELVTSTFVEKLMTHRITMTFPVLNNARDVCMLVAGKAKSEILRTVFSDEDRGLPVQKIRPARGTIHWFIDQAAASALPERRSR